MRSFVLAAILSTAPSFAVAQVVDVPVAQTGVNGTALSTTPTTSAINMENVKPTNQLALTLVITPGTTTVVDVRCYESQNGTNWEQIGHCDTAVPKSACGPDVRQFTLADYETVSSTKRITSRWGIKKKYAKCSADDPDDGTGTVVVTGARSWQ